MLKLSFRLFIIPFYKANAGFFLFFFFFFFGSVNAGSLISYHLSLFQSILNSSTILTGVLLLWTLYAYKCCAFIRHTLSAPEGNWLYQLQVLPARIAWMHYLIIYFFLFAPVFIYALILVAYGIQSGYFLPTGLLILYQTGIIIYGSCYPFLYFRKLLNPSETNFTIPLVPGKIWELILTRYFLSEKRMPLLLLKILGFAVLYMGLVLNPDHFTNDSFVLFFELLVVSNALLPFYAAGFMENRLSLVRNLPLSPFLIWMLYALTYALLFLPELFYLLIAGWPVLPFSLLLGYYAVLIATLLFLTAMRYSESRETKEFLKVIFALVFVSVFALHIEALWVWTTILLITGTLLFLNGYTAYEPDDSE
jgi:hypothetical protein